VVSYIIVPLQTIDLKSCYN